jgi:hypothetical protein
LAPERRIWDWDWERYNLPSCEIKSDSCDLRRAAARTGQTTFLHSGDEKQETVRPAIHYTLGRDQSEMKPEHFLLVVSPLFGINLWVFW